MQPWTGWETLGKSEPLYREVWKTHCLGCAYSSGGCVTSVKYRPSDYQGREGDESSLCLDPSRSGPIHRLHSTFYQLIDILSMDYRITETFRSKVRRNVRLREYYRSANCVYIHIYIYTCFFSLSFFKRKFYVDIASRDVVIILILRYNRKVNE